MIDTLGIIEVGIEHALPLHRLSINKVGSIPIKVNLRTFIIGYHSRVDASQCQIIELAHGIDATDRIVGIERETRLTRLGHDVFGDLERDREMAIGHANTPLIEHIFIAMDIPIARPIAVDPDF